MHVVSVNKFERRKFITLTTVQGGDAIFALEFQRGIYLELQKGWYLRSHTRLLFDFKTGINEIPLCAGFGKIFNTKNIVINIRYEPQYDFSQKTSIIYMGVKLLF